jgi:hypothetical protein
VSDVGEKHVVGPLKNAFGRLAASKKVVFLSSCELSAPEGREKASVIDRGSPAGRHRCRDTRGAANASTAAAAMASRDLNIGDVNIVLREVSHATTEPLATTLIKTLSTQIGTFATAAPQSLVQLLHCPSSEVAAEVMLTLHDKAGGDDHAAR